MPRVDRPYADCPLCDRPVILRKGGTFSTHLHATLPKSCDGVGRTPEQADELRLADLETRREQ